MRGRPARRRVDGGVAAHIRKARLVGFAPVEQHPSFPQLEQQVLAWWRAHAVYARSVAQRADGPRWTIYEGPPTGNGMPGVHHVPSRTFKDVFPRHRTMKGYHVPRQAGWDCHGIPVEVEVERELGFSAKADIEAYGVAAFNQRCRESVQRYVDAWIDLTERVGYWVEFDTAYWTMATSYVESVWWSLKELFERGLMVEGHRVVPYCSRCGTPLSDHEVAQGYAETQDPSVYGRLPVTDGPLADEGASLLVWTTTPWTLIANTAVAVGPHLRYALADPGGDDPPVVVAADLVEPVLGQQARVRREVAAEEMLGAAYQAPFDVVAPDGPPGPWRRVVAEEFVTTDEGTGLVHLAPAFGADDMAAADQHGLPVLNPVDDRGCFDERVTAYAGQFVKDADAAIIADLDAAGVLLASGTHTHTYPFCWRCDTPLLYQARSSWYVRTTAVKDRLLAINDGVDWHPDHIKHGRYGNWLANNVDWALSRERYWGTPLPLWRCEDCEEITAIGSLAELGERAGRDLSGLDPHRPHVDEVVIACRTCQGAAHRVPEVIDAWYDSGAMPFARWGYPHQPGSQEAFAATFPADYICEGIDQTRGWFYSLMAEAALLFDDTAYAAVVVLGTVLDDEGKKMSKSRGNVVDPWRLCDTYGADALRWQLISGGAPWASSRVGDEVIADVLRRFFNTLWNTYYFFVTYARLDGWTPTTAAPDAGERPVMDRWALAELDAVIAEVDAALTAFDATRAARRLETFVDDLSNWYVRRTRDRFWAPGGADAPDKAAAFATLHTCLVELAGLLAPLAPFVAEVMHGNLAHGQLDDAPDSVHLRDFPSPAGRRDEGLRTAMAAARHVVELGRRARNDAQIGLRQPLAEALVGLPADWRARWEEVSDVVAAELNVKRLWLAHDTADLVAHTLKPNFAALGPVFGSATKEVAAAIEAADAEAVAAELAGRGEATLQVQGEAVTVTAAQVRVIESARSGWQTVSDGEISVALDVTLTDELRAEGAARDVVRAVNELRKHHDLALDDRIRLTAAADGGLAEKALGAHADWIATESLAPEVVRGEPPDGRVIELADGSLVRVEVQRL